MIDISHFLNFLQTYPFVPGVAASLILLVVARLVVRRVFSTIRSKVRILFKWHLALLFTIEYRLRLLDQLLPDCPSTSTSDPFIVKDDALQLEIRRALTKLIEDLKAFDASQSTLRYVLDLSHIFALPKWRSNISQFAISHLRLTTELSRAAQIVILDVHGQGGNINGRYARFLRGGPSPIDAGGQANSELVGGNYNLRVALNEHKSDIEPLAKHFFKQKELSEVLDPNKYWKNWSDWKPSVTREPT